jgi:fatty-acyl-CoA synthase
MLQMARPTLIYGEQRISADSLEQAVCAFAAGLYQLGVRRGDRVALWLPNCPAWLVAHLGASRLGAITMALNTRFKSAEVEDILARSGATVLLYWPGFLGINFDAILADVHADAMSRLRCLIVYQEDTNDVPSRMHNKPAFAYYQLIRTVANANAPIGQSGDGCILFTTSGTTGPPKLALHAQASITQHADEVAPLFGYDQAGTTLLQALPLCGTFGHAQAMSVLRASGTLVLMPAFDLQLALTLIRRHQVTALNGADTMFEDMWREAAGEDLASVHGGGFAAFSTPDPVEFVSRAEQYGLELFGLYGMSEVQALFSRQRPGAPPSERAHGGGRPISANAAFRICDPDSDVELPLGEAGELQVCGPSMFTEYFGNRAATSAAITTDGFLRTGDLACDEGDGRFRYLARMGDSLRLGGFITSPAEIEAYIERDPAVENCQVVGVDGERGTQPVAFVIPRADQRFDAAALHAHCMHGLAKYKVPVRFIALDTFPMTMSANGEKIQRLKLRDMATAELQHGR